MRGEAVGDAPMPPRHVADDRSGTAGRTAVTGGTKGERTRRRVLDAAAAMFAREGIAGTSMGDVAAAVGMKGGSLYFHFASKEALVREVLGEGIEQAMSHLERTVDLQRSMGASPQTMLRAAIEAHLVALHDLSDYATVVARGVADRDRQAEDPYLPQERRYGGYWIELLEQAQRAGVLDRGMDPRLVRDLLFGAMNATPMRVRPPEEIAETLATLIGLAQG